MAISTGKKSTVNSFSFKRYIGIAPCKILAVNPNKAKMEELFGSAPENEPVYVGKDEKLNVPNTRITFVVQPIADFEVAPISISFFLTKSAMISQAGKCKVIDKYGRTAWVTKEEFTAKAIPMYSNGPAQLDKDYKPCYIGQEELVKFLISYMWIEPIKLWNNNERKFYENPNKEACECSLDNIDKYFNGDISEITKCLEIQPENIVDICFGVRNTEDGKQYQAFFKEEFTRGGARSHKNIERALQQAKERGAYATTEFATTDFKEYSFQVTEFKPQAENEVLPDFASAAPAVPDFSTPTASEDNLPFNNASEETPW
jgi:hypothetical protein